MVTPNYVLIWSPLHQPTNFVRYHSKAFCKRRFGIFKNQLAFALVKWGETHVKIGWHKI